jgi:EAL domain-containing protein (putative c-di-GMP-specific phosphodiesterase class I)/FixJ family two-component response regulator
LLGCSSSAMQRAKQTGGNGHQLFNEAMHKKGVENQILANELRMAIGLNQLSLHYQPLVDLQTGAVGGMEALLRWQHPTLGAISPARFIAVAEECGLIKGIGTWVLRKACEDMRSWLAQGLTVPQVAINVSPIQFRDIDLAQQIETTLAEFGIDPHLIYIEVTEGALMEDVTKSVTILHALKSLGVKLSLDDFGTGYSSLSYLKLFPFDKVKIDQSFVRNILTNNEDAVIATVVVSMAHGLGLRVIAEGVETEAQCAFLRDNMCDEIQGYFFSKAIPASAIQAMLLQDQRLAAHLMRTRTRTRTILLVDDEPNVVSSLKRLFRRDGYTILSATSGQEGLDVLAKHPVDIILSDQRMPGMTGVEFLRSAKKLYPNTLRIVLSGYTELQSVTDAINEGAVFRFLTKPWIDDQLRSFILEAFQHKEMADENQQLNLKIRTANSELARNNRQLLESNQDKQQLIARSELSLNVARETLHRIPLPVIGVDEDGMVAFVNSAGMLLLNQDASLLGADLVYALPELDAAVQSTKEGEQGYVSVGEKRYQVVWHAMGDHSTSRGKIISLVAEALLV